jgi:hypothetical protein
MDEKDVNIGGRKIAKIIDNINVKVKANINVNVKVKANMLRNQINSFVGVWRDDFNNSKKLFQARCTC